MENNTYIKNTIQMNLLAATTKNENATNQVFNVAVNDRTSLIERYLMIEERLIQRVKGLERNDPIFRDFRVGDVRHSLADIGKAQRLLDYVPQYKISEGMDEVIDWYTLANIKSL